MRSFKYPPKRMRWKKTWPKCFLPDSGKSSENKNRCLQLEMLILKKQPCICQSYICYFVFQIWCCVCFWFLLSEFFQDIQIPPGPPKNFVPQVLVTCLLPWIKGKKARRTTPKKFSTFFSSDVTLRRRLFLMSDVSQEFVEMGQDQWVK